MVRRQSDQLVGQADTIAGLREERGLQTAELERAALTIVTLNVTLDARTAAQAFSVAFKARWHSWGRWWSVVAVLVPLVVAGVIWLR
jgi:hypothetical protein